MDFRHKFIQSSTGKNETTLLLLHGTGGNEEDLVSLGNYLSPEAALLGVRGQVLENGMPRFFRRLSEGVFDEEDLIFRTHELAGFVEEATSRYALNPERIIAVGYSNGANIAASMLLLQPCILAGAVLLRAMVPLEPQQLPDLSGKHVLMQSGRQDPIVPTDNSERLGELLKQAGAVVTLNWQNTGHGLTHSELSTAQKWINQLSV